MSTGAIKDIKEARKIIANGENLKLYEPKDNEDWDKAYEDFKNIINK
jgi:rhamnulokinase/L-fuculokinase